MSKKKLCMWEELGQTVEKEMKNRKTAEKVYGKLYSRVVDIDPPRASIVALHPLWMTMSLPYL